ncbi:IMP cyclohydrolase [Streptomyces griseorubiginosus]|uniref:IMP cyclohydrolase n=1 Tax=Streptomyces griseorubiginosus TaxID=67304 RepID=UPI003D9DF119
MAPPASRREVITRRGSNAVDSLQDVLAAHDYPGRGVLWCTTGDGTSLGAYFLTGRSPASQARTLRRTSEDTLVVAASDTREHDHLRHYVAARQSRQWLVFGNGEQVSTVADRLDAGRR